MDLQNMIARARDNGNERIIFHQTAGTLELKLDDWAIVGQFEFPVVGSPAVLWQHTTKNDSKLVVLNHTSSITFDL